MEWLYDQLDIVLLLVCTNIALSAVNAILDKVKDKTANQVDNKISDFLNRYLGYLQKAIDWLTANRPHK